MTKSNYDLSEKGVASKSGRASYELGVSIICDVNGYDASNLSSSHHAKTGDFGN